MHNVVHKFTWISKCRMFNTCTMLHVRCCMYDISCTIFNTDIIVSHSYFNKVTSSGFNEVISTIKIHVDPRVTEFYTGFALQFNIFTD